MVTHHVSSAMHRILRLRSICNPRLSTTLHGRRKPMATLFTSRFFNTESQYHYKADETLENMQDILDFYFEENPDFGSADITYASGVLTISLPKGTWVLNKQTPNRQIWWSSPLTGPRRYEFAEKRNKWVWSRFVDNQDSKQDGDKFSNNIFLGETLKQEMVELFLEKEGLDGLDDL
eukprot:807238_1